VRYCPPLPIPDRFVLDSSILSSLVLPPLRFYDERSPLLSSGSQFWADLIFAPTIPARPAFCEQREETRVGEKGDKWAPALPNGFFGIPLASIVLESLSAGRVYKSSLPRGSRKMPLQSLLSTVIANENWLRDHISLSLAPSRI